MIVVVNSSPLISLSLIGALGLLPTLYRNLHIAEAVYQEIVVAGTGRSGSAEIATATWLTRHTVADSDAVTELMTANRLNAGESETLVLARQLNADLVIIDERPARRYAIAQGLPITGTLGILPIAKSRQLIPAVRPLMTALAASGMRLDLTLYAEILRRAGE